MSQQPPYDPRQHHPLGYPPPPYAMHTHVYAQPPVPRRSGLRTASLVLGVIAGAWLLLVGIPLTISRPAGLPVFIVGALALGAGITARRNRVAGGVLQLVAALLLIIAMMIYGAAAFGIAVPLMLGAVPFVLLVIGGVLALVASD